MSRKTRECKALFQGIRKNHIVNKYFILFTDVYFDDVFLEIIAGVIQEKYKIRLV